MGGIDQGWMGRAGRVVERPGRFDVRIETERFKR
jgi:hypothetical protein